MKCRYCGFETRDPIEVKNNRVIKDLLSEGLSIERVAQILSVDRSRVIGILNILNEERHQEKIRDRDLRSIAYE